MPHRDLTTVVEAPEFDPYQVLNVNNDAKTEEIEESYRKLSRILHPDRSSDNNSDQFEAISRAKEMLCDKQTRKAYDKFGLSGVEMMQRNVYNEIRSLKVGKKYRNDEAVEHLIKYYMKREATLDLDKLVSAYGQCEMGIDATSFFEEIVDLTFRKSTIPQFIHNVWNGIPTLQIVLDANNNIVTNERMYEMEPVNVVDDDYDFTADFDENQQENAQEFYNNDYYNDNDDLSMSEMMTSKSIEDQVDMIKEALKNRDISILKHIPVERQSVSPKISSFLVSLGYSYELNDSNDVNLTCTQYISNVSSDADNSLYHSVNAEWHHQYDRFTKLISVFSFGLSTLSSRFGVSRNIDEYTNLDVNFYFNFLDSFWMHFGDLFAHKSDHIDSAADLVDDIDVDNENNNKRSLVYILPELLTIVKNACISMYNFVNNSKDLMIESSQNANLLRSFYPGFDVSFSLRRLIFNNWMGIASVRLGQRPSFQWHILRNIGPKHWNFQIELSRNNPSILIKRVAKLEKTTRFYSSLMLSVSDLLKFECGFEKTLIDDDLQDMLDHYQRKTQNNSNTSVDVRGAVGIGISLKNGVSLDLKLKRGPSGFAVPIKLAESPASLQQLLLTLSIPLITLAAYKWYYKPRALQSREIKVKEKLNEIGLLFKNKRDCALKQQNLMKKDCNRVTNEEIKNDGLIVLCAYYGDHVQRRIFEALRSHKQLDDDENDDDDDDDANNNGQIMAYDDNREEEKKDEIDDNEYYNDDACTNGKPPPPLLFGPSSDLQKQKVNRKNQFENNRYHIQLKDVEWIGIENELMDLMNNDVTTDMHLPQFLNVRIPLQSMVKSGKLSLSSGNKWYLPGFYDCSPDSESNSNKELFVVYKCDNVTRYVLISDVFPLTLPNNTHLQWFNVRNL